MNRQEQILKAAEFDEIKAREIAKHEDSSGYFGFLRGAKWQAEQLQSIISHLCNENEKLRSALEVYAMTNSLFPEYGDVARQALTSSPLDKLLEQSPTPEGEKGEHES